MTYTAAEDALLTAVRGGGAFGTQNSSRGDFTVLDRAGVERAAVLWQGGPSDYADEIDDYGAHGYRQERHRIAILLFQSRGQANDGTTTRALHAAKDTLIARLDTNPTLSGAALRAEVVSVDIPRVYQARAWVYQAIQVEVRIESEESEVPEI